ncbi:MAG: hypothetical protein ACOX8I_00625 [Bacillota bacterium]|mgnify:CR=1 FL=1|jgi:hypothetical protein
MIYEPLPMDELNSQIEPVNKMEVSELEPEPEPKPEPDEIADLRSLIDVFIARRELTPHRVSHFIEGTYRIIENAIAPFRRLEELSFRTIRNSEDNRVQGFEVAFFQYRLVFDVSECDLGDYSDIHLGYEADGEYTEIASVRLRFGEGEWNEDLGEQIYRHVYRWITSILE